MARISVERDRKTLGCRLGVLAFSIALYGVLAFSIALYGILAELVQRKTADNFFLLLPQDSADSNPLLVSILLKFSCFPETINTYGSAILKPIRLWMFVSGTVSHGWTFSALWTYPRVDSPMRSEDPSIASRYSARNLAILGAGE
jgi:hypothetical protein